MNETRNKQDIVLFWKSCGYSKLIHVEINDWSASLVYRQLPYSNNASDSEQDQLLTDRRLLAVDQYLFVC